MQSTKCSFDGCDKPIRAKSLCNGHYKQNRMGWTLRPLLSQVTLEQRFLAKVNKTAGCWEWTGAVGGTGYGQFKADGQTRLAHRVSWELTNGPISDGMFLDHRCANKRCVNPAHLRIVTNAQNLQHLIGANKNSTSGIRGVRWDKRRNAWRVHVKLNGRQYHGGYHPTIEAADKAARALRARLFTHDDHDEWPHDKEKAS